MFPIRVNPEKASNSKSRHIHFIKRTSIRFPPKICLSLFVSHWAEHGPSHIVFATPETYVTYPHFPTVCNMFTFGTWLSLLKNRRTERKRIELPKAIAHGRGSAVRLAVEWWRWWRRNRKIDNNAQPHGIKIEEWKGAAASYIIRAGRMRFIREMNKIYECWWRQEAFRLYHPLLGNWCETHNGTYAQKSHSMMIFLPEKKRTAAAARILAHLGIGINIFLLLFCSCSEPNWYCFVWVETLNSRVRAVCVWLLRLFSSSFVHLWFCDEGGSGSGGGSFSLFPRLHLWQRVYVNGNVRFAPIHILCFGIKLFRSKSVNFLLAPTHGECVWRRNRLCVWSSCEWHQNLHWNGYYYGAGVAVGSGIFTSRTAEHQNRKRDLTGSASVSAVCSTNLSQFKMQSECGERK